MDLDEFWFAESFDFLFRKPKVLKARISALLINVGISDSHRYRRVHFRVGKTPRGRILLVILSLTYAKSWHVKAN
jgi:hypothetical protein